ncbi:hypothetical protein KEM48_010203 [Puccinia striiformis f. sp. tritici PST-130]|uniref:Uncharacterized protein n=1 Tax=Puccinia striiformis f. sp. tritici PST-78 TaxID=1165861 RepID=A0A0L0UXB1_9BASI|nr:hypothetical protein KEM48_010203 [Puccinia striiformis f. sp. tritici PST-130]KNE91379.1 hypothetical protein PSTG_15202 [Puccinia striiformis f. sp. tritici PST-78]
MDNPKARDKHLPAINPLIDSMDQEFCQQNPSCQFDQDTPDRSMYDPGHPYCIVPTTELTKLWAMMNLDNEHYEQALQILCMPGGPISFLVMKELERHQEKSNNRGKSSDPPWDNQPKLKDFGAAIPQEFRVQQGFERTHPQLLEGSLPADQCGGTHVWCLIHKKLLEGVLDSEGDIAPGLVLPRLNEITQTLNHLLHPPLQKKISQWTLINKKLSKLKAHEPNERMAFTKAVIVRDNELFGTGTVLADIAEHHIILPRDKEVQAQLPLTTSSQPQPNPLA